MADVIYTVQAKTCPCCGRRMTTRESCGANAINDHGEYRERIRFGDETWGSQKQRCPSCRVARGGFHHAGCEYEQMPLPGITSRDILDRQNEDICYAKVRFEETQRQRGRAEEQVQNAI